jgi:hypothetical protein
MVAAAIFVFLESLDEFTRTYFVGVPDVKTLPLMTEKPPFLKSSGTGRMLPTADRTHLGRRKPLPIWRGTGSSNPPPSSGESANHRYHSALSYRRHLFPGRLDHRGGAFLVEQVLRCDVRQKQ